MSGISSPSWQHFVFIFLTIQDRKLVEEYFNQPKPKIPVAAKNFEMKEEEGGENWEKELVEHSYNPLEVA